MIDLSPLTFDEVGHVYRWHGTIVPSVTQLIRKLGHMADVPDAVLEPARERGQRVHAACELDDRGDLDERLAADVMGYVDAWRRFSDAYAVRWALIEQPLYHPMLRYAGKPDRIGTVGGLRTLVDIKSGAPHPVMGVQLAAYERLADASEAGDPIEQHLTVHLSSGGDFAVKRWDSDRVQFFAAFCGTLSVYNWIRRYS